jgi:hypothetical protein
MSEKALIFQDIFSVIIADKEQKTKKEKVNLKKVSLISIFSTIVAKRKQKIFAFISLSGLSF